MMPSPAPARQKVARYFEALVIAVEAEERRLGRSLTDAEIDEKFGKKIDRLSDAVDEVAERE